MALTPSTNTPVGLPAPDFALPEPGSGKSVELADYRGGPVAVIFMCNHCPYVVHILEALVPVTARLQADGIQTVAISANDIVNYPADAPDKMAALAAERQFGFPYLYDESQEVARAYGAECTPDLYLFDAGHKLFYRGQFDSTRPGAGKFSTGEDLLAAAAALTRGDPPPSNQIPSVGCGIKWKSAVA